VKQDNARRWVELGLLALLALWPLGTTLGWYSPFYFSLMTRIVIFGVALLGYDLAAGYTGLVSFGHALFIGLGGYAAGLVLVKLAPTLGLDPGLWLWLALGTSVLVSAVAAVVVGFLALRTRGIYFVFLTLAFGQFAYLVAWNWLGFTGGDNGLTGIPQVSLALPGLRLELSDAGTYYYFVLVVFALSYALCRRVVQSPFGRILVGIEQNEKRTAYLGYPVIRYKRRVFLLSGVLGGLAGGLYALLQGFVSPDLLHWHLSGDIILMTWLGGVGTLIGPVLGGFIYLFVGNWLSTLFARWQIVMGLLFVFFVLFSPRGMVGLVQQGWRRLWGSST